MLLVSPTRAHAGADRPTASLLSLNLLAAAVFGAVLGFARLSYGLLLPSLRTDLSGSYGVLGLVGSINLAGYLAGTLSLPLLLLRVGDRRGLNLVALLAMNLTLAMAASSTEVLQLAAWRFLTGLASGPATVLTIALTLERFPAARRGAASGLIWAGGAAGLVVSGLIGPLLGAAPDVHAWRLAWPTMAIIGLATALALHRALGEPSPPTGNESLALLHDQPEPMPSLRRPPLLWLASTYFCFGVGYIIYFTFAAALLVQQGAPTTLASLTWALVGLAGVLGGIGWGRAADGRARWAALPLSLAVAALGGLAVLTGSLIIELAGAVLMGTAAFGAPSLVTALLRRAIQDDRCYTSTLSFLTAVLGVGQVLGPLVAGQLSDAWGVALGTSLAGVVLLLAALPATAYGYSAARAHASGD